MTQVTHMIIKDFVIRKQKHHLTARVKCYFLKLKKRQVYHTNNDDKVLDCLYLMFALGNLAKL